MKLHISSSSAGNTGDDKVIAVLPFNRKASEVKGFENVPVLASDCGEYLDVTTVEIPGSNPILVRGGLDPEKRGVNVYVASNREPVLTLAAFCPHEIKYSPVAMVRLPSGHVLQFMVEADG